MAYYSLLVSKHVYIFLYVESDYLENNVILKNIYCFFSRIICRMNWFEELFNIYLILFDRLNWTIEKLSVHASFSYNNKISKCAILIIFDSGPEDSRRIDVRFLDFLVTKNIHNGT